MDNIINRKFGKLTTDVKVFTDKYIAFSNSYDATFPLQGIVV